MYPTRLLFQTITLCCLLSSLVLPVASAEIRLSAFEANYKFYYGPIKVANAKILLSRSDSIWSWRLSTDPVGVASLLTGGKQPYSETTFTRIDGRHKLQSITIADKGKNDKQLETANFDWNHKQVTTLRKDVANSQPLSADVYDHLTIHLLAAKMQEQGLQHSSVDFYYKGKLVKTKLSQVGKTRLKIDSKGRLVNKEFKQAGKRSLEIDTEEIDVVIFEQTIEGSSTKSTYYYKPDTPYLPMKIETEKPGKTGTTMLYQGGVAG